MGIENVEMWVIKWEKFWNDNREKKNGEREREKWYSLKLQVTH